MKKILVMALSWILAAGAAIAPAAFARLASAAEVPALDQTSLIDDLSGIDLDAYPKNETGTVTLLNFSEFGYAQIAADSDFGIYLYVYNPTERELSERVGANVVNMAVDYDAEGMPMEYANLSLTVIDRTDNFRFYKFRVTDGASIKARAREYAAAHGERRYDVVGIQLWGKGSASADAAEDNLISATYYFSGYAAGFDVGGSEESTLTCRVDKLETVPLTVYSTYYRQDGINGNGAGHHNQLSSVYFAIPKDKIQTYGMLYAVKCFWNERRTAPIIVTNRQDIYDDVSKYLGVDGSGSDFRIADNASGTGYDTIADWAFNPEIDLLGNIAWDVDDLTPIGFIFKSSKSSILDEHISSADMKNWISEYNFADYLFTDDVDEGRTYGNQEHTFYVDDPFDMTSFDSTASGWDKFVLSWQQFFGGKSWDWGEDVSDIEPIKYVTDEDFAGTDAVNADNLFINDFDYGAFKTFYDIQSEKNDVFLLRFAVTDYYANLQEVSLSDKLVQISDRTSTYMARETVFLNFDIIELAFKMEDGTETVLGVVADPIDIISGITPPNMVDGMSLWEKIIALICLVVLIIALLYFLPMIATVVVKIIEFPFKLLSSLFKRRKRK